jgi:hypothetical protein
VNIENCAHRSCSRSKMSAHHRIEKGGVKARGELGS